MLKKFLKKTYYTLALTCLRKASQQSGRLDLIKQLREIVPDISSQYSTRELNLTDSYEEEKIRSIHAFQLGLVQKGVDRIVLERGGKAQELYVVDIGDSAGTHGRYIKELIDCVTAVASVNIDPRAVEKIKALGGEAILSRAEDVQYFSESDRPADLFLSFQMLEHLFDPATFMHGIAQMTETEQFVISVPFVRKSRIGLKYIRHPEYIRRFSQINAENTHIFELSPNDWKLLFLFSGWKVVYEETFFMYPRWNILSQFRHVLRRYDFEGFQGFVLKKDLSQSNIYQDW